MGYLAYLFLSGDSENILVGISSGTRFEKTGFKLSIQPYSKVH